MFWSNMKMSLKECETVKKKNTNRRFDWSFNGLMETCVGSREMESVLFPTFCRCGSMSQKNERGLYISDEVFLPNGATDESAVLII